MNYKLNITRVTSMIYYIIKFMPFKVEQMEDSNLSFYCLIIIVNHRYTIVYNVQS